LCWVAKDGQNEREGLNPHHYCQPLLQTPEDRDALVSAATSGNPKFFLGSDTAPHEKERKESECGCAGVFNAPVIMPVLAKIFFDKYDDQDFAVKALEQFTSVLGAQFYGFTLNESTITVQRKPWIVKRSYHCIVPLCAGKELEWQVQL
jgi:dihydroorotase